MSQKTVSVYSKKSKQNSSIKKHPKTLALDLVSSSPELKIHPQVIGKGTYGCVHKPSLRCKQTAKTINYKNKISKYMLKEHAKTEMKEYGSIHKADPKKYLYLGKPEKCSPSIDSDNRVAIKKCDLTGAPFIENYFILIMNDGGLNLADFARRFSKNPVTPENKNKIELFLIEAQRILYGLTVFLEKDIVHHDLKAQNIVYNEETNRINFIDFGLMTSRKELIESSRNSNNRNALPHWSYPFELQYLNKRLFERLCSLQQRYKINIVKNILDDMDRGYISSPYRTFFNSIMPNSSEDLFTKNMNIMLNDFMDFLLELKENNYDDFLNKSINTIDTYGVGIAFTTVLSNCAKFIEPNLLTSLSEICAFMMCAHLPSRYEPAEVLHKYEELMHTSGLLEKHNKYYDNHIIKEGKAKPDGIAKLVSKVDPTNLILSPDEIEKLADRPPMICRSGEEQHPLERRCIKKCKDGKVRNEKFRCVKNKTVKKLSK
uniref:Protein kinase domain-containing protein n=1 Tax=viral metagenome TaxID=1070528 RepID=A0A6C0LQE2_9ZZZZ